MISAPTFEGSSSEEKCGFDTSQIRWLQFSHEKFRTEFIISNMKNYEELQPLMTWDGDTSSLISEMKRRMGVSTDSQLAEALGRSQSAVSHWRRSGSVPEQVLLEFEHMRSKAALTRIDLFYSTRAVALRVAEVLYQRSLERGAKQDRWLSYMDAAIAFESVEGAISDTIGGVQAATNRTAYEVAADLLDDLEFLDRLAAWIEQTDFRDIVGGVTHRPKSTIMPNTVLNRKKMGPQ